MLSIELDIYSMRPNPEWKLTEREEHDLVERIVAHPSLIQPIDADTGGLGYRGYIVRAITEDNSAWQKANLPAQFRLAGVNAINTDAARWLLDTSDKADAAMDDDLRDYAAGAGGTSEADAQGEASPEEDVAAPATCQILRASSTDFSFWNLSSMILLNNSYNFAANNRTGTYAQPGRRSGRMYRNLNPGEIIEAAQRDGLYIGGCPIGRPVVKAALVYSFGRGFNDYHWYRLCFSDRWCHKPGRGPARNTDNSGRLITNIYQANHGTYTTISHFFHGYNPVSVS